MPIADIIPEQVAGEKADAAAHKAFADEAAAKIFYQVVRNRLLDVNYWHEMAGLISAVFQLTDASANEIWGGANEGNYIRIDIPGPGSHAGGGYDWVIIELLKDESTDAAEQIGFRVRPSRNPAGPEAVAHFYSNEATSSFLVTRNNSTVTTLIADRNLQPNNDTHSVTDTIRHTAAGMAAIGFFSRMQWQKLADGLLQENSF